MAKTTTTTTVTRKKRRRSSGETPHRTGAGKRPVGGGESPDLSRRVQLAMIPRSLPAVNGLDIRSLYLPRDEVAGDLFDVILIDEDLLAFYVLDVSGRGTSAALMSALAKVSFQNHIRETASAAAVLERVNGDVMRATGADFLIAAFVAYLDLHNNKLTYSTAEHPYPLVYRKQERALAQLRTTGVKLGVSKGACFEDESMYLSPGDRVLFFSDGVYQLFEGKTKAERLAGFEEMLSDDDASIGAVVQALEKRYTAQSTAGEIGDDISVVGVEILTQSRKNQIKEKLGFRRDDPVYLQFISYYEEMDAAAGVILKEMDMAGFPDETIRKMKISLTELLANAIGHGNGEDHSRKVTIGHIVNRQVATVSIMDEGDGFDPSILPDPTLPENLVKDHGRGLYIVNNYVDEIEHNAEGNRVLIRKYHV